MSEPTPSMSQAHAFVYKGHATMDGATCVPLPTPTLDVQVRPIVQAELDYAHDYYQATRWAMNIKAICDRSVRAIDIFCL